MPSKSLSRVVLSVKTVRPEVKDHWLPIPAEVLTIDGLIRHILIKEFIDKDMDDVELYLFADLLRGDTSVAEVLRDRDRIELRLKTTATAADGHHKQRINSLANTSSDKKRKTSFTIAKRDHSEDSPDSAVGHTGDDSRRTADRWPTKRSKKSIVTANRSQELVSDSELRVDEQHVVTSSGLVESRRPSLDNKCSGYESPTTASAVEVVVKAENRKPKIKRKHKPRKVATNEAEDETKTDPIVVDKEKVNDDGSGAVAPTDGASGGENRPKSGQKMRCESDGCDYKTRNAADFAEHQSGHNSAAAVTDRLWKCVVNDCGKGFKQLKGLSEHHLRVHPNECPDMPWIECSHTGCAFRSKSNGTVSKHLKVHNKT
ncbi:unnamed protein product [Medioppia subpectinata]|uniref:C2H2-type domain-containing protein n=1 Tax=Medioppia subpectinata TaxID=1979941 RepID=A0A7R9KIG4_9ACAR|nr:unnamed protein product [Medioppia subpectinata]CAG2102945.1 unnamed protein product [Medioppia subpectinata]